MLTRARRRLTPYGDRITLLHQPYAGLPDHRPGFDLIVLSYCLSMINPGWGGYRQRPSGSAADGLIAVVDFTIRTGWRSGAGWVSIMCG